MLITRRGAMLASAATLLGAAPLSRPALAQSGPILIGWLAALTGPSSAPAIGFDRGVKFAVGEINAAGGVKGRTIEIVTRDTQGDPTKAVNATQDMISRQKVNAIWGHTNSGEAIATSDVIARAKMPNIHPLCRFRQSDRFRRSIRNAFRVALSNGQWDDAVRNCIAKIVPESDGRRRSLAMTPPASRHLCRRRLRSRPSRKEAGVSPTLPTQTIQIDATRTRR